MKPCVLLYHFQGTRRGRLLKSILVTMGVRIKNVERSEYRKPSVNWPVYGKKKRGGVL